MFPTTFRFTLRAAAVLVVARVLIWLLRHVRAVRRFRALPIPGPPDHWLLGSLPTMARIANEPRKDGQPGVRGRLGVFQELRQQHGDVVKIRTGVSSMVLCFNGEIANALMHSSKPELYKRFVHLLGNGVAFLDGDVWKRRRVMVNPAFSTTALRALLPTFQDSSEQLSEVIEAAPADVDISDLLGRTTLDIIARAGFGYNLDSLHGKNTAEAEAVNGLISILVHPLGQVLGMPGARLVKFIFRRQFAIVDRLVFEAIDARKNQEKAKVASNKAHKDMLDLMLAARDENGKSLSRQQLRDEVRLMFVGGSETTALTLQWCLAELALQPSLWNELWEELRRVSPGGERLSFDQLRKLNLLDACLNESLRLYPPTFSVARDLPEDTTIAGHALHKGLTILICVAEVQRDPKVWGRNASSFDPKAHFGEGTPERTAEQFLPFAFGERACLGRNFFWTEARVVMADLISRFETVELLNEGGIPAFTAGTGTIHPVENIRLRFRPRAAA